MMLQKYDKKIKIEKNNQMINIFLIDKWMKK